MAPRASERKFHWNAQESTLDALMRFFVEFGGYIPDNRAALMLSLKLADKFGLYD